MTYSIMVVLITTDDEIGVRIALCRMLLATLVTYIVYLAYNPLLTQHLNRLAVIDLLFTFYLA